MQVGSGLGAGSCSWSELIGHSNSLFSVDPLTGELLTDPISGRACTITAAPSKNHSSFMISAMLWYLSSLWTERSLIISLLPCFSNNYVRESVRRWVLEAVEIFLLFLTLKKLSDVQVPVAAVLLKWLQESGHLYTHSLTSTTSSNHPVITCKNKLELK